MRNSVQLLHPGTMKFIERENFPFLPFILFSFVLFSFFNSSFCSSASNSSQTSSASRKSFRKTDLGFLNDLPKTQSSSSTEHLNLQRTKSKQLEVPETIPEIENEEINEDAPVQKRATLKSFAKSSEGPSEEDRLIDDQLKFLISYYDIYEKIGGPSNPIRHFGFIFLLTLMLALLFYLMYSISSDYLTPSLAHLSSACRMSPDMAGLTFLAFGNGAPDLFTAMLGAEDAPEMILGSSIGSGLFIFTVVFGLVIIFARDPGLPTSSTSSTAMILAFPNPKDAMSRVKIGRGTFWRNALMYGGCVVALAVFVLRKEIPLWQPLSLMILFFVYLFASIAAHYMFRSSKKPGNLTSEGKSESTAVNINCGSEDPVQGSMKLLEIERKRHKLQQMTFLDQFMFSFKQVTEWDEMGFFLKSFWILTSPLRLILNLTILPLPDPTLMETPDRLLSHWFLSRFLITLNPIGSILLLGWLSGIGEFLLERAGTAWTIFCYVSLTAVSILIFHLGSAAISNPLSGTDRNWRTSWPLWLATIYSFTCCIAWIYAISNELVAGLSSLGLILGVSRTVMGCLVLAWGNSIGDLIADVALARNGAPQTAITAIFSGPVQNVLLTIGISFMAAAAQSPNRTIRLSQLRGDLHLSLALLAMVICGCLILIPGYFKYRIPRQFGYVLVLLYIVYVPFSLWLGINS